MAYSLEVEGKDLLDGINLRVSAFEVYFKQTVHNLNHLKYVMDLRNIKIKFPPFMMSHRRVGGNFTYSGVSIDSLDLVTKYFHHMKYRGIYTTYALNFPSLFI